MRFFFFFCYYYSADVSRGWYKFPTQSATLSLSFLTAAACSPTNDLQNKLYSHVVDGITCRNIVSVSCVNFINNLHAAFTHPDPENAKKDSHVKQLFVLSGSSSAKTAHNRVDEIDPLCLCLCLCVSLILSLLIVVTICWLSRLPNTRSEIQSVFTGTSHHI